MKNNNTNYEYLIQQILESEYCAQGYTDYYNMQEDEVQEIDLN